MTFHPQAKTFSVVVLLILFGFFLGVNQGKSHSLPLLVSFSQQSKDLVSITELRNLLKNKNFTFINVHTPYEGEIEKTDAFIRYDEIPSNSATLPKDKNAPIILYCKSGRMSGEALTTLKDLGYTNVRHVGGGMDAWEKEKGTLLNLSTLEQDVIPTDGIQLPVSWGDIGPRLVELGVIDLAKFKQTVKPTASQELILTQSTDQKIKIDRTNVQFIVDMLWALGLAQKSLAYEEGPMGREYKKDAGNFSSTGGWSLARGKAINYLGKFDLIPLTGDQQQQVKRIAQNVYRPCCGNSTWFPDCNHGMAALAAIELMVAAGVTENDIYRYVLALNSYWFSNTYVTTATYFARQGIPWNQVDAREILGAKYSSSQGAAEIAKLVGPLPWQTKTGGGCSA